METKHGSKIVEKREKKSGYKNQLLHLSFSDSLLILGTLKSRREENEEKIRYWKEFGERNVGETADTGLSLAEIYEEENAKIDDMIALLDELDERKTKADNAFFAKYRPAYV